MSSVPPSSNSARIRWFCISERLRRELYPNSKESVILKEVEITNPQNVEEQSRPKKIKPNKQTDINMSPKLTANKEENFTMNNKSTRGDSDSDVNAGQDELILEEDEFMDPEASLIPKEEPQIPNLFEASEEIENVEIKPENEENEENEVVEDNIEDIAQLSDVSSPKIKEEPEIPKSEDDAVPGDEEEGIGSVIPRRQLAPRRARMNTIYNKPKVTQPKKPQTRNTRIHREFKGRDVVFVDPLDPKAEFWWPAMIVPNDEIDESMDVDGKLEKNLLEGKFLVRYFEDMTYSVVEAKGLRHFEINDNPCKQFVNVEGFNTHIGVRRALKCIKNNGEPIKKFKWDYWMRPANSSETISPSSSSSRKNETLIRKLKHNTFSKKANPLTTNVAESNLDGSTFRSRNQKNNKSRYDDSPAEDEEVDNEVIKRKASLSSRRNSRSVASRKNSILINTEEEENHHATKRVMKRRRSNVSDRSDDKRRHSEERRRSFVSDNSEKLSENISENMSEKLLSENLSENLTENLLEKRTTNSVTGSIDPEDSGIGVGASPVSPQNMSEIDDEQLETEVGSSSHVDTPKEHSEEPVEAEPASSKFPVTFNDLNEEARDKITKYNFDYPNLDKESKANLYDEGLNDLKNIWKDYREIRRNMKKIESELKLKKLAKLRGTSVSQIRDENVEITNECGDSEVEEYSDYENHMENGH
ncbi:1032_t:CDS:2 [Diversispora eburnea]|uniref:1032_t:CDS:1 n=1 Tax=Diversispora eburnea TaxID=1213867 RepID=A0A9N8V8V6_9GLOM|nr:1032_t:CDS:2 [Diversispora eburnea]